MRVGIYIMREDYDRIKLIFVYDSRVCNRLDTRVPQVAYF